MSSDRELPESVKAPVQMLYRSSGLGVWGLVLRYAGMPLEKIALFSNSSQVSGKGIIGQAVKLTFADGALAPFKVVGKASAVAWFLQYSVMGFVFQGCDRALSSALGVDLIVYGDDLYTPGVRFHPAIDPASESVSQRRAAGAGRSSEERDSSDHGGCRQGFGKVYYCAPYCGRYRVSGVQPG